MSQPDQDAFMINVLGMPAHLFPPQPSAAPAGPSGSAQGAAAPLAPMDKPAIVNFLLRHRFGPAPEPDAPDGACIVDGGKSTLAAVGKMIDDEAAQYGRAVDADKDKIVSDTLADMQRGHNVGAALAKAQDADKDPQFLLAGLKNMPMAGVLEALEGMRAAHQLDSLLDLTRNKLKDPRLEVAILSVQHHLGGEWEALMKGLSDEADRSAIRGHVFGDMEGGDQGDLAPIKHGGSSYSNDSGSDADWIKGFLDYVRVGPDPQDSSGQSCSFDGVSMPIQRAIDSVVEQGALAGRLLKPGAVADPLSRLAAPAPPQAEGGIPVPQYSLSYGFPLTGHVDLKSGKTSADELRSQVAFTGTIALHPDNKPGPELSWTVQVAVTDKTWKTQQILQGPQAAWAWSFLDGTLQIQVIAAALTGLSNTQDEASGRITMAPSTQLGASGQVTYGILGKKVLFGLQAGPSVTATSGQSPTGDFAVMAFVQVQWQ